MSDPKPGDHRLVFDNVQWGDKDTGNNAQFWHEAEILETSLTDPDPHWHGPSAVPERIATVRFLYNGRVGRGHFVDMMREVP